MVACELCGSSRNLVKAIVEGSILNVCENCAHFGKAITLSKNENTGFFFIERSYLEEKEILFVDFSRRRQGMILPDYFCSQYILGYHI